MAEEEEERRSGSFDYIVAPRSMLVAEGKEVAAAVGVAEKPSVFSCSCCFCGTGCGRTTEAEVVAAAAAVAVEETEAVA